VLERESLSRASQLDDIFLAYSIKRKALNHVICLDLNLTCVSLHKLLLTLHCNLPGSC
jgi:hypothetical protein